MNKIIRKCRDFGIIIRLNELSLDNAYNTVHSLKKSNLPLCLLNTTVNNNWPELLKEISTKEDLFIAVEGLNNITDVYTALAKGAQFFLIDNLDLKFLKELEESGIYFIPKISDIKDLEIVKNTKVECIMTNNSELIKNTSYYNVLDNSKIISKLEKPNIFNIIDLPIGLNNIEYWTNEIYKEFLGLNYIQIKINKDLTENQKEFVEIFSATNKCYVSEDSIENSLVLECKDFTRSVKYLKWRDIYINPNNTVIKNDIIVQGILDKKINDFSIILKEKEKT